MKFIIQEILQAIQYQSKRWKQPCLIAIFGFPGAGKTACASILRERFPMARLTTDEIRLKYGFASGPEALKAIFLAAEKLISENQSVIIDGIHMGRKNRDEVRQFGQLHDAHVRFVHVVADGAVIKQRLDQRAVDSEATAKAGKFLITDEHFQQIISYFEAPDGEADVVEVDTSSSFDSTVGQLEPLFSFLNEWLLTPEHKP